MLFFPRSRPFSFYSVEDDVSPPPLPDRGLLYTFDFLALDLYVPLGFLE